MKKHISLPDGIAVVHVLIEELAHHPVPGIAREIQCIVDSHPGTRWERHTSPSHSRTRRKRHESRSPSHSRRRQSRSHSRDFHTNKGHYRSQTRSRSKARCNSRVLTSSHHAYSKDHKSSTN